MIDTGIRSVWFRLYAHLATQQLGCTLASGFKRPHSKTTAHSCFGQQLLAGTAGLLLTFQKPSADARAAAGTDYND